MKKNRTIKKRLAAAVISCIISLLLVFGGTAVTCAQTGQKSVTLEKTAAWTDPAVYQAQIDLKVDGIERYTQREVPISVIPLLDVTASMDQCETPGHQHKIFHHWVGAFEDAAAIWNDLIRPSLPTPEEYGRMGRSDADAMLLRLPAKLDPSGKCRLAYLKGGTEQKDYYTMVHWRVFYVTDDVTPLRPLKEKNDGGYAYGHTVLRDGCHLPVGNAQETGAYTAWVYIKEKEAGHGCQYSRLDQLKEGYAQFIQTLFENPGARVCPVAFVGGYHINGWTGDAQEAVDFIAQEKYLEREAVLPDHDCGTNYEAALAGAVDAVGRMGEQTENVFAILFTDGEATSGYDHTTGQVDPSRIDPHSFGMPDWDVSWYPTYAQWAIQDAEILKKSVAVYTVGYGFSLEQGDVLETLRQISSGGEYFIDTRSTSIQTVTDIFRKIYADIIYKATKVHIVDYISEYWDLEKDKLPEGCQVEEIPITNRKGQPDVIYKLIYPVTREMGADGAEEIQIPVTLRAGYRDVAEKTLYETNQDSPLEKDQEGTGAYVEYVELDGTEQRTSAKTPRLDVYPAAPGLLLEKKARVQEVRAGEEAEYEFRLVNTGQTEWRDICLTDVFSEEGIRLVFDQAEGTTLEKDGETLCIGSLGRGEEKILTGRARIPEDFGGLLENTVTAAADDPLHPGKEFIEEAKADLTVVPLTMDFEVEKTVDKMQAMPGETLTYQIRIANTGERELRSTVATDRFMQADIQAVFEEQEGVTLQKDGTQAVVESILPGEEVILIAVATVPPGFTEEELINTVLVAPEGMEGSEKTSQAVSTVKRTASENSQSGNKIPQYGQNASLTPTTPPKASATVTAAATMRPAQSGTGTGSDGKPSATSPSTGDDTPVVPLVILLAISGGGAAALAYWRRSRR